MIWMPSASAARVAGAPDEAGTASAMRQGEEIAGHDADPAAAQARGELAPRPWFRQPQPKMMRFRIGRHGVRRQDAGGDRLAGPRFLADGGQHRVGGAILDPPRGDRGGQR